MLSRLQWGGGWGRGEGLCLVPCLCEMPFIIDEDILFQCLPAQELGAFPGCVQPLALQRREYQVSLHCRCAANRL